MLCSDFEGWQRLKKSWKMFTKVWNCAKHRSTSSVNVTGRYTLHELRVSTRIAASIVICHPTMMAAVVLLDYLWISPFHGVYIV